MQDRHNIFYNIYERDLDNIKLLYPWSIWSSNILPCEELDKLNNLDEGTKRIQNIE